MLRISFTVILLWWLIQAITRRLFWQMTIRRGMGISTLVFLMRVHWRPNFCAATSRLVWTTITTWTWSTLLMALRTWTLFSICWWKLCLWIWLRIWIRLHKIISLHMMRLIIISKLISILRTTRMLLWNWSSLIILWISYLKIILLLSIAIWLLVLYLCTIIFITYCSLLSLIVLLASCTSSLVIHYNLLGCLLLWRWGCFRTLASVWWYYTSIWVLLRQFDFSKILLIILYDFRCTSTFCASTQDWCYVALHLYRIFLVNIVILLL